MKLFGRTKKSIDITKNGENVPSLEVVEVVSVQCNLVDNQIFTKVWGIIYFYTEESLRLSVKC